MIEPSIRRIEFTPAGEREFKKFSFQLRRRIFEKLKLYTASGNPIFFARPLVNLPPATHRFRIGKYRVLFYLRDTNLIIDGVDKREDAYRGR